MLLFPILVLALVPVSSPANGQLDNSVLSGIYHVRHVMIRAGSNGTVNEVRSILGNLNFDGRGGYTFQGQQNIGTAAAAAYSATGSYSVKASGLLTLSNPQATTLTMNGRLGSGITIVGSTTDSTDLVYDLMVAVQASTSASAATLTGNYSVSSLDFLGASTTQVRNAFYGMTSNGAGSIATTTVKGQAANLGPTPLTQTISGASYTLAADGTGTASFPIPSQSTANAQLVGGSKVIYSASDGSMWIGGSTAAGSHDILVGVKALTGATAAVWKDLYYAAGLRYRAGTFESWAGAVLGKGDGTAVWHRRDRIQGSVLDFSGVNSYSLNADGTGTAQLYGLALGAGGEALTGNGISANDFSDFELSIGIRAPVLKGTGVYVNPQSVHNSASFAPIGNPVSPGGFVSLFGTGLAAQTVVAGVPFPTALGGVEVSINGQRAPIYFVTPTQVSALVPFATTGSTASIVVTNNNQKSNTVEVPLAKSSPGIFSMNSSGLGGGAILHLDYKLVTAQNPARQGETVQVYLTGLGTVTPTPADGAAAPVNPLSLVPGPVNVYIGDRAAQVLFKGLAPTLAGLYALNITIPKDAPLGTTAIAIETPEAFHDQVDIYIAPAQ